MKTSFHVKNNTSTQDFVVKKSSIVVLFSTVLLFVVYRPVSQVFF